jgi:hypothetical protein
MCAMKVRLLAMGVIWEVAANLPGHVVITHTGSVHRYDEERKSTLASNGATAFTTDMFLIRNDFTPAMLDYDRFQEVVVNGCLMAHQHLKRPFSAINVKICIIFWQCLTRLNAIGRQLVTVCFNSPLSKIF